MLDQLDDVTVADTLDVVAISVTEAKLRLAHAYLDEHGQLDESGKPRPAAEYAIRLAAVGERAAVAALAP